DGRGARGLQSRQLLDLHQAHAARADRFEFGVVAEDGDVDTNQLGGFDQQSPFRRLQGLAVDGQQYRLYHGSNGHRPPSMCATYSPRYCLTVAVTGLVAKSPSAHSTLPLISPERESRRSRSPGTPRPCSIRVRILCSQEVPSRHGVHLPHDSWRKNSSMSAAERTMHVSSSSTINEAEPSIDPAAWIES